MRAQIGGGSSELVLTGSLYGDPRCARSLATLCAIAGFTPDPKQLVFTAFDPLKGRGRELCRLEIGTKPDPDYEWDLLRMARALRFVSIRVGKFTSFPSMALPRAASLSADEKPSRA